MQSKQKQEVGDIVCMVCSDGDFADDNLIVMCGRCNVAVHQNCYGIQVVPQGDWICDLCEVFGRQGRQVACAVCP